MSDVRVFLGAQEISGMMRRLKNAFKEMGVECDFFCLSNYKFDPNQNHDGPDILKKYSLYARKISKTKNICIKAFWHFFQAIEIVKLLKYVKENYDYFLYIFGHGMFGCNRYLRCFQEYEYKYLKKHGKKCIMWFCGSDSRAPYCDVVLHNHNIKYLYSRCSKNSKNVKMIEKYMLTIDNPASSHFHSVPYIIYQAVGIPVDKLEKVERTKNINSRYVRILHAPSDEAGKGTKEIRNIIDEIKRDEDLIEYIEISGKPHSEVLNMMRDADILIDQIYSDTPMAGLAAEASINALPVIVSGYYCEEFYLACKNISIPPTVYCMPHNVKDELSRLINNKEYRESIGKAQQQFVNEQWNAKTVAQKILNLFEGNYPPQWMYEPKDNKYIYGWGVPKEKVVYTVKKYVEKYGMKALRIPKEWALYRQYEEILKGDFQIND